MARPAELAAWGQLARFVHWEAGICLRCNRYARNDAVRRFFAMASRLGDGIAWYGLLAMLPVAAGPAGIRPAVHMAGTAFVAVGIYKFIKKALGRERPSRTYVSVKALVPALDRYSFPSGHTMHAAMFTAMLAHYFPALLILVVPFAIIVAMSRIVLGLHYPTDVAAGALLGFGIARVSLGILPLA